MPPVVTALLATVLLAATGAHASPQCNTRSGFVSEQPPPPQKEEAVADAAEAPMLGESIAFNKQTLLINLGKDLDSLIGISGRYTNRTSVLGVRLENLPGFNDHKHCNRVTVRLYKPSTSTRKF